jgi:hypothetical protein
VDGSRLILKHETRVAADVGENQNQLSLARFHQGQKV